MKHIKKFNEKLGNSSINDLNQLRDSIKLFAKYKIELSDAIDVLDKLLNINWTDIKEWRDHISTNYSKSEIDKFTLEIIDRYCSPYNDYDYKETQYF